MDIEASGFGQESYPIEIGVIFDNGEKYCQLIKPEKNWTHWDTKAEALHRISRRVIETQGASAKIVANELNERLGDITVYSDCWTVDKPWLDKLFHAAQLQPTFKLRAIEMIMDEPQWNSWADTHAGLVADNQAKRHRASVDAENIQRTWLKTKQRR